MSPRHVVTVTGHKVVANYANIPASKLNKLYVPMLSLRRMTDPAHREKMPHLPPLSRRLQRLLHPQHQANMGWTAVRGVLRGSYSSHVAVHHVSECLEQQERLKSLYRCNKIVTCDENSFAHPYNRIPNADYA
jgi:hypothetical protein